MPEVQRRAKHNHGSCRLSELADNKLNHLYTSNNCAMGKIGSTGEVDYCMGGCYLNDSAGHFLCFHPTSGQFYYIDRFANGKRNYGYGKALITEDMHEDKREELKKQKERIEADLRGGRHRRALMLKKPV